MEFTEWKSGDFSGAFPSAPGNYVLAEDVTIRTETWTISSGVVNLCLNGHTLNMTNGGYILLNGSDAKLNICDYSEHGSGSIKSVSSNLHAEAISITHSKSTLNLYGGNICAEFNGTGTAGSYAYGVNTSAAPVNIYGGTVTAKSSASKAIALNVTSSGPKVSISGGVFIAEKSIGLKAAPEGRPINATGGIFSTDPTGAIDPSYTARKIKTTDAGYQAEYADYYILEPASAQPAHTHSWAAAWNKNATHHWHECTADGCDVTNNSGKDGYAEHTKAWVSTDAAQHWQTCATCGWTGEKTAHVYDDDADATCNTCGYTRAEVAEMLMEYKSKE